MKKFLTLLILCLCFLLSCDKASSQNGISLEGLPIKENADTLPLEEQLFYASRRGNLEEVKKLIAQGADVNVKTKRNDTPLWEAAHMNHTEIVRFLLENGAKDSLEAPYLGGGEIAGIELEDPLGTTPLFEASFNNNNEMVNLLLNAGAKDNIFNAGMRGDLETVKSFIENGVDVNENYHGNSALTWAARFGHTEIVKFLIEKNADVNMESYLNGTILMFATKGGHTDVVKLLIEAGADVNKPGFLFVTPLMKAAENGHTEIVNILLDAGANVNAESKYGTALSIAQKKGNTEIAELLKSYGAKEDFANTTLNKQLLEAVEKGNLEEVKKFIAQGADVNLERRTKIVYNAIFDKVTPLWVAAHMNHTEIVRFLLENGAKDSLEAPYLGGGEIAGIELEDPRGTTPLFEASFNNNDEMVKLLLNAGAKDNIFNASMRGDLETVKSFIENGVDVNENEDNHGNSALTWAARFGHTEIVKFLIEKNADVNMESYLNGTILMFATKGGHTDVVKLLIEAGADVNKPGFLFVTPLMKAAENGHTEIVKILLDAGANVNAESEYGTALSIAQEKDNTEIVELLKTAGAKE